MQNISSILHYSTIDIRFLEINLQQLSKFSKEIIIPICTHLFEGSRENEKLLQKSYEIISKYPKAKYILFDWEGVKQNPAYYHTLSRQIGTNMATSDWILFVDADEIVDDVFIDWFKTVKHTTRKYWLTCFWYFREPTIRATTNEGCGLLIRREQCNWNLNLREERQQLFVGDFHHGGYDPIFIGETTLMHHYSWVRSKDEMIKKVRNWGHKGDTNWVDLVENEFTHDFNGTDFIHGYDYIIVPDKFNIGGI